MKKPNILFILTDQQRHDTCGCYGQELEVTPNLDKLAKDGILFSNAFTCQPVCGPVRSCIQTGMYATETGCFRNGIALPLEAKTLAHFLKDEGYETSYIGKWHLASTIGKPYEKSKQFDYTRSAIPPERRGGYEDYWLASDLLEFTSHPFKGHLFNTEMNKVTFEGYRVDCLTDFALKYLENATKPFFFFLSYLEPHQQNDLRKFVDPYNSKVKFKHYAIPNDLKGNEGDWEEHYPDYLGCCNSIDLNFIRIYDKLEELGLVDDTIIIYTSDHGCHFQTRCVEYKRSCHDSSIHIPLIMKIPDFHRKKVVNELISLVDLPPTILDLAGVKIPEYMKGRSILNILYDKNEDWPQQIFVQISEAQVGRAIRTSKWKYSVCAPKKQGFIDSRSKLYQEDFLYDLENDPYEQNNLVANPNYKNLRIELSLALIKEMIKANEPIPKIVSKPLSSDS